MKFCVEYECVYVYILVFKYINLLLEELLIENIKKESR